MRLIRECASGQGAGRGGRAWWGRPRSGQAAAAVVLGVLLALGGCAATLPARVTAYHPADAVFSGARFKVVPDAAQVGSLQFEAFAQELARGLMAQGLKPSLDDAQALEVRLAWAVTQRGSTVVSDGFPLMLGLPLGVGVGIGRGAGVSFGMNLGWAFGGADAEVRPTWERAVTVTIARPAGAQGGAGPRLYEATARTLGGSADLAPVVPLLIRALFVDFPGRNGQTWSVDVPAGQAEVAR